MTRHSFDPDIAQKVGVNAAVIFANIVWWCERNAIKGRNHLDDNIWTFNSVSTFEEMFPYLTARQIGYALQKLEDSGMLEVGNYNEHARDRTKWYALAKGTAPFDNFVSSHLTKLSDPSDKIVEPLPDSKPDKKQPPNPQGGIDDLFGGLPEQGENQSDENLIAAGFKEFWNDIWPKHFRKAGRADCRKVYFNACTGKHPKADQISPSTLNRCTRAYIASVSDPQYLKGPLPWLRKPGWEPFLDGCEVNAGKAKEEAAQSLTQQVLNQYGSAPVQAPDDYLGSMPERRSS